MKSSVKPPDYHEYVWTTWERIRTLGQILAVLVLFSYFFYRSVWAMGPLLLLGVFYFKRLKEKNIYLRQEKLLDQFRECIMNVAALLQAGYSLENAFLQEKDEMENIYGKESDIYAELAYIRRGLHINISIEDLLEDFAERSGIEDIVQFAQVVMITKRSGGDMADIMQSTAQRIGRKIELHKEMQTALSARKMEFHIMRAMPFVILAYVNISNPGYFDVLYHNISGIVLMTICLIVFLFSTEMGERILKQLGEGTVLS